MGAIERSFSLTMLLSGPAPTLLEMACGPWPLPGLQAAAAWCGVGRAEPSTVMGALPTAARCAPLEMRLLLLQL